MERKLTREVKIGSLKMGGTNPIIIQSMCNTDTRDVEATVAQILALEKSKNGFISPLLRTFILTTDWRCA